MNETSTIETPPLGLDGPLPQSDRFTRVIADGLLAPFPLDELEFLPKNVSKNGNALALPYIDARAVMNRLDQVVGAGNWSFDFDFLDTPACLICKGKLTVLGITKCDIGQGQANAKGDVEQSKSAVSDALKRCAVHFGIGRFLYYLPPIWAPYDETKRRFTQTPQVKASDIENACRIIGFQGKVSLKPRQVQRELDEGNGNGSVIRVQEIPLTEEQREKLTIHPPASIPPANPAPDAAPQANLCSVCKLPLTAAQATMSTRQFGRVLCPVHQAEARKAGG